MKFFCEIESDDKKFPFPDLVYRKESEGLKVISYQKPKHSYENLDFLSFQPCNAELSSAKSLLTRVKFSITRPVCQKLEIT